MNEDLVIRGIRRSGAAAGQNFPVAVNEFNEVITAPGGSVYAESTRKGTRWKVKTATPFTPLVVVPTTLANLEIKNNHGTLAMEIDAIYSWQLLGTAVVWAHTPWAQVGAPVVAAVTALVVYSSNGRSPYTSTAATDAVTAVEQTVVANGWEIFPGSTAMTSLAAATPGGGNVGVVDGRLIVPPGKALHVAATASIATASSMHVGASWFWRAYQNE